MSRLLLLLLLPMLMVALFAGVAVAAEDDPTVPKQRSDDLGKLDQPKEIDDDIKRLGGKIELAFIGDSITRRWRGKENQESWMKYWDKYNAINMGVGGDGTHNVLYRLQNGHLDGYKARVFVVMIGTNNCWGKTIDTEAVAAGIKKILELIQSKQPQAKILLLSILPVGDKPNPAGREKRMAINKIIETYASDQVHYLSIWDKFLTPESTIPKELMPDFLHLSPKGYEVWSEAIKGKIEELMNGGAGKK